MIRDDQMTLMLVVSFWMASMTTDHSSKQSQSVGMGRGSTSDSAKRSQFSGSSQQASGCRVLRNEAKFGRYGASGRNTTGEQDGSSRESAVRNEANLHGRRLSDNWF